MKYCEENDIDLQFFFVAHPQSYGRLKQPTALSWMNLRKELRNQEITG